MEVENENLLYKLEENLEQYDIIFLVLDLDKERDIIYFAAQFGKPDIVRSSEKKVMCITTEDIEVNGICTNYRILKWDAERLRNLYYMYEFSDRFCVLSKRNNFGNIFNFINTGILTWKEVFEALL